MGDNGHHSVRKCECSTCFGRVRSTTGGKGTSSWVEIPQKKKKKNQKFNLTTT